MPNDPTYLADTEAAYLSTEAIPGALVVHLSGGRGIAQRRMFIELSVSEAVQHWQEVGALIRKAGAMDRQPPHADAATNL